MKSSLLQILASSRIDFHDLEEDVSDQSGSYKGLSPEALYNSLEDFIALFNSGYAQGTFADLGCGTGVSCLTYGALFPERKSIGVEFEASRLSYAKSFIRENNVSNVELIEGDLLTSPIPDADTYFLYFPTGPSLDRILTVLYQKNHHFRLIVVESHGDLIPRVFKENWLKEVGRVPLFSPRHNPEIFIFEKTPSKRLDSLEPFTLSYQRKYLILREGQEEWVGETYRMEWSHDEEFDLLVPPRRITWKNVTGIMELEAFPEFIQQALLDRYNGIKVKNSFIRKIFVKPSFALELSTGERIELDRGI